MSNKTNITSSLDIRNHLYETYPSIIKTEETEKLISNHQKLVEKINEIDNLKGKKQIFNKFEKPINYLFEDEFVNGFISMQYIINPFECKNLYENILKQNLFSSRGKILRNKNLIDEINQINQYGVLSYVHKEAKDGTTRDISQIFIKPKLRKESQINKFNSINSLYNPNPLKKTDLTQIIDENYEFDY